VNRTGAPGFGDADDALDAERIDGIGHIARTQRLSPRGLHQSPAYLRGRVERLAARLREEGGDPGKVVTAEDTAALLAEVLRLEGEIGAALNRKREPVTGLDEPGAGEAIAAE
jgi:hypothetical protein